MLLIPLLSFCCLELLMYYSLIYLFRYFNDALNMHKCQKLSNSYIRAESPILD